MEILKDVLQVIIYTLLTGCGMYVVYKVVGLVNTKIDELQANTKLANYEKLNKIIDKAQSILYTIVESVSQTYVDSLKKSGKFDSAAQTEAKNKAITLAKDMITDETANAITEIYGNLDSYLDSSIESIVKQLKETK